MTQPSCDDAPDAADEGANYEAASFGFKTFSLKALRRPRRAPTNLRRVFLSTVLEFFSSKKKLGFYQCSRE